MNIYLVISIVFAVIAILALIYVASYSKLKGYKEKMEKAESLIEENLDEKFDLIIAMNSQIKKVTGKKDYLKDYTNLKDMITTNIEKDLKLEEAVRLINELMKDFTEINSDKEFMKNYQHLREVDEVLVASKNLFNQNALQSNQLLKTFPYSLMSKVANFKIRSYYTSINKTDEGETF